MLLMDQELVIRLSFFLGIFSIMALWENRYPRRKLTQPKWKRWLNNLGLTLFNSVLLRILFPVAAVGVAILAQNNQWGLFQQLAVHQILAGIVSIIILDFAIYSQHLIFHKVPILWRLHRMHHTDLDIDVTTGARFHPVEIILSMLIKIGIVLALGAPAWSVVVFEVILNATSMFNHSNAYLKASIDRFLRLMVVTPDMHRVHHSVLIKETDSNYGFNFPWWDRLLGTYTDQPKAGHDKMTIGLANYRDPKWLRLEWMLFTPFARWYR
ncbi:sterol desaturase family protein [Desulfonatronovibrio hydrogenovorans]|uniref:sterol desaturase family protein n=1 Tax=Desulfonatronovibrio hydrogenovorans TaxID=53245 RepID=UPI0005592966|nr:sterol desaturase family protein [Desulfonatronovibrio hydrogenovorans]